MRWDIVVIKQYNVAIKQVNIIKHPPTHTHTYTHCVLSMRETQLHIRWGCRSRGDGVHIHEVNSMKTCCKPIEHTMHVESSDTGKKSSNWGDSNLGSHLLRNTLARLRERASLISIWEKYLQNTLVFWKPTIYKRIISTALQRWFSNGSLCFNPQIVSK